MAITAEWVNRFVQFNQTNITLILTSDDGEIPNSRIDRTYTHNEDFPPEAVDAAFLAAEADAIVAQIKENMAMEYQMRAQVLRDSAAQIRDQLSMMGENTIRVVSEHPELAPEAAQLAWGIVDQITDWLNSYGFTR